MKGKSPVFVKGERANMLLFSSGILVSLLGSSIYVFAISLYVLNRTGSGLSFAITLIQGVIPILLIGPFAGVLSDRFSKKLLLVSMDIANGVLFAILFIICSYYELTLPIVYIAAFLTNSISVVYGISLEAVKPNLVSDNNLIRINLFSQIINSLASIMGPVIGGIIFAFIDIKLFMLFNALSFFCSGISAALINYDFNNKRTGCAAGDFVIENVFSDIKDGVLYVFREKELKRIIGVFVAGNIFLGLSIMVPFPYAVNNVLKLGPAAYGFIEGFLPVGMILGAFAVEKVYGKVAYDRIISLSLLTLSISIIAIGVPLLPFVEFSNKFCLAYYSIIMAIIGAVISFMDIPLTQKLQTVSTEEYRGRVFSTIICVCKTALPLALLAAGVIIELLPVLWIFLGVGCFSLIYSILLQYITMSGKIAGEHGTDI